MTAQPPADSAATPAAAVATSVLLTAATRDLAAASDTPRLDAELLLAFATGRSRSSLLAFPERTVAQFAASGFAMFVARRAKGEPVAYLTGTREFHALTLAVDASVLVPRPETELCVDAVLARCVPLRRPAVLDVGTGSGALAVTLHLELGCQTWATEISPEAAAVAVANAARLHAPVHFVICDVMDAIAPASIDLIVSNPPYVPLAEREGLQREVRDFEPHVALFAGQTGFEIYDRIVIDARRVLRPGGRLIMELGFGSLDRVREMLAGWRDLRVEPDLAGIPRVIAARL